MNLENSEKQIGYELDHLIDCGARGRILNTLRKAFAEIERLQSELDKRNQQSADRVERAKAAVVRALEEKDRKLSAKSIRDGSNASWDGTIAWQAVQPFLAEQPEPLDYKSMAITDRLDAIGCKPKDHLMYTMHDDLTFSVSPPQPLTEQEMRELVAAEWAKSGFNKETVSSIIDGKAGFYLSTNIILQTIRAISGRIYHADARAEIAELRKQIAEKADTIESMKSRLNGFIGFVPSDFREMKNALEEKDTQIAELKRQLAEKDKRLESLRDKSECPPDCDMERWCSVLADFWGKSKKETEAEPTFHNCVGFATYPSCRDWLRNAATREATEQLKAAKLQDDPYPHYYIMPPNGRDSAVCLLRVFHSPICSMESFNSDGEIIKQGSGIPESYYQRGATRITAAEAEQIISDAKAAAKPEPTYPRYFLLPNDRCLIVEAENDMRGVYVSKNGLCKLGWKASSESVLAFATRRRYLEITAAEFREKFPAYFTRLEADLAKAKEKVAAIEAQLKGCE
jgi:cell division septum initiation protein DivIVA